VCTRNDAWLNFRDEHWTQIRIHIAKAVQVASLHSWQDRRANKVFSRAAGDIRGYPVKHSDLAAFNEGFRSPAVNRG
jgi:hypothetical protein